MTSTNYSFGTTVRQPYAETVTRVKEALKQEGFGVLTEIDMQATLKEKLDENIEPYLILGACNPQLANRALQAEHEIGVLLPCNVVIHAHGDGQTRVSIMDPEAALGIVGSDEILPIAKEARERLNRALASLADDGK